MSVRNKLVIFIIVLLVLDQAVKIWIKTHMMIGEEFSVFGNWFKILFIENNGMAFGMELGDGKGCVEFIPPCGCCRYRLVYLKTYP